MEFILLLCIYTYRFISCIFKSIISFLKHVFLGVLTLCYGIGSFVVHFFIGFEFIFSLIFYSFMHPSDEQELKKVTKEELKKKKMLEKAKIDLQKKNEAEEKLINKLNEDELRKEETFIDKEKAREFRRQASSAPFEALKELPKKIKTKITKMIDNNIFVRNARNKKDINRQALLIDFNSDDAKKSKVKVIYEYEIKTPEGKMVRGYFAAHSKVEVHSFLLSEGNIVYNIRTSKLIQLLHGQGKNGGSKIRTKDLIFMLAQLSTYLKAGIPLVESIKILIKQFNSKTYERILRGVIYDLTTGESFSEALAKQGNAFPKLLISMVKASEMTGKLPEALDEMEEYFTEAEETRKAMITAMMYPMIIFFVALAVGVFIMLFVVPKFVDIYNNMDGAEIPGITLAVLAVSDFLEKYILWLALGVVIILFVIIYLYKNVKNFRSSFQWVLMHIPVIKNIIIYNEVTMFSKTFASLLSHNVFITDSMDILNRITNNEIYKSLIVETITNLARGERVSTAFKDQWAFPLPAYEMIVTGEKTGQLPEMMTKVSNYYQDLHKNSVSRIKTFIEPIMILVLTAIVGVIVLSIVIPMFNMYDTLQK